MQLRYQQLVQEHLHGAGRLTSGLSALPQTASAFASFQAAWRFYANERTTLGGLCAPLQHEAQQWRQRHPTAFALMLHDWSSVKYPTHTSKTDQACLSHGGDWGYELSTALLIDGRNGDPVAPLELRLRAAAAVHSTRTPAPAPDAFRIDEVLPTMQALAGLALGPNVVHIIDREADSLAHYRQWQAAGQLFLVRADGERTVRWQDGELTLAALGQRLEQQGAFRRSREVSYRGQQAVQHVAETTVVLDRPAWRNRRRDGQAVHERVPGPAITLRLIVSRVCNSRGETVAVWYLLTNVPPEVTAATVALWYYWRWRIESYFKLLKSAGQQLEQWQQETGLAIAKRLLIASMACVVVWRLERQPAPAAEAVRDLLIRLSGRLMKRDQPATAPALLAGLWVLVAALAVLEDHSVAELRQMKELILSGVDTG